MKKISYSGKNLVRAWFFCEWQRKIIRPVLNGSAVTVSFKCSIYKYMCLEIWPVRELNQLK